MCDAGPRRRNRRGIQYACNVDTVGRSRAEIREKEYHREFRELQLSKNVESI